MSLTNKCNAMLGVFQCVRLAHHEGPHVALTGAEWQDTRDGMARATEIRKSEKKKPN